MAAAAVVSVSMGVMKPVLSKLAILMGDEYKKIKGLRKKVTFLQRELREMDALLEKMDSADELDPHAKNWRKDIIEMSYNIEDCIDDFMQRVGQANDKVGILRKAFKYLRTFQDRCNLANQFEEIKAQVMEASERRKRYILDQSISVTAPVVVDPRISAIYKESASLVGIDAQKNELVNWAMDKEQQLKVMAIVGFGGLGKTTLANEVHHEVGGKFECRAFVSVSQKPNIIGLFKSLRLQLGLDKDSHDYQVQDLINELRGHLQNKRYFIVVDDLWNIGEWNVIRCAFPPQNCQHSRVLITTRIGHVATACCDNHEHIYNMKPLGEQDSKKLFFNRIFGSEDACPSELRNASSEILKKCDGLPLALITMASMLACQPRRLEGQWEYIQNSLATKSTTNSNYEDMMYILDLSYKNLSRPLKACFLYLGSYPEDHKIDSIELVRRWVAEGFVSNSTSQDVWDLAESYFNELVNRSIIQPTYYEHSIGISSCKVHDMLLELILRKCKEDNFLSLVNDSQAVVELQDKVIRRLNVVGLQSTEDDRLAVTIGVNPAQIRSLSILGKLNWIPSLLEFKFVRVLSLDVSYWHDKAKDLTVINHLSLLRYLKVKGSNLTQIRGLPLLEIVYLKFMSARHTLQLVDVPRLSHLTLPSGTMLPNWVGKVKSLRTLHGFCPSMDSLESIVGLGELSALSELSLYISNDDLLMLSPLKATCIAALITSLEKLSNLKQLAVFLFVSYNGDPLVQKKNNGDPLVDGLSSLSPPFCNLERLDLQAACTFSRVPRWITHLGNLRELWIGVRQILQEDVANIGMRLRSLIILHLRISRVLTERVVIGGSTGFPVLRWFEFDCDEISYLTFETGAMPELQELKLVFNFDEWNKAAPGGLQHLPSLNEIIAHRATSKYQEKERVPYRWENDEAEVALIRGVFQEAADALPTQPAFFVGCGLWHRQGRGLSISWKVAQKLLSHQQF